MSLRKVPWLSIGLLLAAHMTFGWFLYTSPTTWVVWACVITLILLQSLLLTIFSNWFRSLLDAWLQSDLGYFSTVIIGAMLVAFVFIWANVFGYVLVVIAAEALARLDLQNARFGKVQAFLILSSISITGLVLGQAISRFL